MAGRPRRRARVRALARRNTGRLGPIMPLFPPDSERDEEGLINLLHLAFGRRQAEALLLALPVLQERGIRLVKYLDEGTYGAAYLTDRGTVIKLTTSEKECQAAKKLGPRKHPNIVRVYDVVPLGEVRTWRYCMLELEKLTPIPEEVVGRGRHFPQEAADPVRRAAALYTRATGFKPDLHVDNFGWDSEGRWTLLDLGPAADW